MQSLELHGAEIFRLCEENSQPRSCTARVGAVGRKERVGLGLGRKAPDEVVEPVVGQSEPEGRVSDGVLDRALSFVGAKFDAAIVARVTIRCGNAALAAGVNDLTSGGTKDLVVIDNVIYGEPTAF